MRTLKDVMAKDFQATRNAHRARVIEVLQTQDAHKELKQTVLTPIGHVQVFTPDKVPAL